MEKTYSELKEAYKLAKTALINARNELFGFKDGFIYLTRCRAYGSVSWRSHNNIESAKEEISEYYGDNGFGSIYTNNPNHGVLEFNESESSYYNSGQDIFVITKEEMDAMAKEDISMSQAICNWIAKK